MKLNTQTKPNGQPCRKMRANLLTERDLKKNIAFKSMFVGQLGTVREFVYTKAGKSFFDEAKYHTYHDLPGSSSHRADCSFSYAELMRDSAYPRI